MGRSSVGSKLGRDLALVVEVAATFSAGQIRELRHLGHARHVAEKRSSRVSETLAEQGLLADQWLMGGMAPRRGEREVSKSSDLQKEWESKSFQGFPWCSVCEFPTWSNPKLINRSRVRSSLKCGRVRQAGAMSGMGQCGHQSDVSPRVYFTPKSRTHLRPWPDDCDGPKPENS